MIRPKTWSKSTNSCMIESIKFVYLTVWVIWDEVILQIKKRKSNQRCRFREVSCETMILLIICLIILNSLVLWITRKPVVFFQLREFWVICWRMSIEPRVPFSCPMMTKAIRIDKKKTIKTNAFFPVTRLFIDEWRRVTSYLVEPKHIRCSMATSYVNEPFQRVKPIKDFLAGGMGSICLVLVGHPADTIKVFFHRVQVFLWPCRCAFD